MALVERHPGAPGKHSPSQRDSQGPSEQRSQEAPEGVQGHDEGPHEQDQVVGQRLAGSRLPRLIGEFLNVQGRSIDNGEVVAELESSTNTSRTDGQEQDPALSLRRKERTQWPTTAPAFPLRGCSPPVPAWRSI